MIEKTETKSELESAIEIKESPDDAVLVVSSPDSTTETKESSPESELQLQFPDERVLWTGQPHPKKFGYVDVSNAILGLILTIPMIPCLMVLGIKADDLTGTSELIAKGVALAFALGFLAVGLLIALRPYFHYQRKKKTHFYVTNKRAVVNCNLGAKKKEYSCDLSALTKTTKFPGKDGYGTIIFEELTEVIKRQLNLYPPKEFLILNTLVFFDVANVDDVQKTIDSVIAETVSDLEQRPDRMFVRNRRKVVPSISAAIYKIRLLVLLAVSLWLLIGFAPLCYIIGSQSSSFGFVDKSNNMVVKAQFDEAKNFSEGLAPVEMPFTHKWGFIDKSGQLAIKPKFISASSFSEGLAAVALTDKEGYTKYGFIDHTGKVVVPTTFDRVNDFSNGLAPVMLSPKNSVFDEKWGFIDRSGKWRVQPKFSSVGKFVNGIAPAYSPAPKGSDYLQSCLIDENGKVVVVLNYGIGPIYPDESIGFSDGLLVATTGETNDHGFIDQHGKFVIKPQFDDGKNFSEGLAAVSVKEKWGFINNKGAWVIKPQYDDAMNFKEGLAPVLINGKWGYVDRHGKLVIMPAYTVAYGFSEGYARVKAKDGEQLIDKSGHTVLKAKQCSDMHEGLSAIAQ